MRIALLLVLGGGVLGYLGIQEYMVSSGAAAEPVAAELVKLEGGEAPANNHLRVGRHLALYSECVFSYRKKRGDDGPPAETTSVSYCFYPILSPGHPFLIELKRLTEKFPKDVPPDVPIPSADSFAVLVKTHRFKTLGEIPKTPRPEESVQGLIINQISSLGKDEQQLLKERCPKADLSKVLILQDGRSPAPLWKWAGMIGGGGLLILVGIGMFFVGRKK
ncbi:MAG: hypothetical protein L0211_00425 [Planctomycetaceae bacterium]|nr:hypothetical protein [Planctomycetaceae bacterium]